MLIPGSCLLSSVSTLHCILVKGFLIQMKTSYTHISFLQLTFRNKSTAPPFLDFSLQCWGSFPGPYTGSVNALPLSCSPDPDSFAVTCQLSPFPFRQDLTLPCFPRDSRLISYNHFQPVCLLAAANVAPAWELVLHPPGASTTDLCPPHPQAPPHKLHVSQSICVR